MDGAGRHFILGVSGFFLKEKNFNCGIFYGT
jgi:hypothetical protein